MILRNVLEVELVIEDKTFLVTFSFLKKFQVSISKLCSDITVMKLGMLT